MSVEFTPPTKLKIKSSGANRSIRKQKNLKTRINKQANRQGKNSFRADSLFEAIVRRKTMDSPNDKSYIDPAVWQKAEMSMDRIMKSDKKAGSNFAQKAK